MSGKKARWGRDLVDRVGDAIQETSAEVIEPRFAALSSMDVRSKAAGELVTDAEELLTRRLTDLLPGAAVVGEEACATDPGLLEASDQPRRGWSTHSTAPPTSSKAPATGQ